MKRFIMICIYVIAVSNPAFSEKLEKKHSRTDRYEIPAPLMTLVSVNLDNVSMEQALAVVSKKGNFKLNYNRDRIPVDQRVTVKMDSVEAVAVLDKILEATGTELNYSESGVIAVIPDKQQGLRGQISGKVVDEASRDPLVGTNVSIVGTTKGTSSDVQGNFTVSHLREGSYSVRFEYIGYKTELIQDVRVTSGGVMHLDVELEQEAILLKELVVTPGKFSIMGKDPTVRQTLTREDLQTITFGEDIYRAINRLPGISSTDFSAKFTIRGGENEEVLVLMNGQELYEPFHLKDIDGGALSIIDVEAIEVIDLLTGGFPAEYGDHKSGVFNMKLKKAPTGNKRTSLGISFMNARLMSEGTFNNNKGSWLVSARRGYLDIVLGLMDEEDPVSPKYYDILGKVEYPLSEKHTLSAHILHAGDRLDIKNNEEEVRTSYGNSYSWLTLKSFPYSRLFAQTVVSYCRMTHKRFTIKYYYPYETDNIDFIINDDRNTNIFALKQDWNLEVSDRWYMKWGFDFKNLTTSYDYLSTKRSIFISKDDVTETVDTVNVVFDPIGKKFGSYFSNCFRVFSPLTAEIGLRYDHSSYSGDDCFSPRINLVYLAGNYTFLRAGWGYFYQTEGIHEIKVQDGENGFYPAELTKHWVAGFEHTFRNGFNFRVESYYKKLTGLGPDYRNWSHSLELFPEMYNRLKLNINGATSKGIEFYFKYDRGGKFTWWSSYALSYVKDDIRSFVYHKNEYTERAGLYPGKGDQRHTFYLDLNYRPGRKWHYNISWQYHTGWPFTKEIMKSGTAPDGSVFYYYEYDEFNSARYPSFHRLDLRINRYFYTSRGRLAVFLAIVNVYNRANLRNIDYNWFRDERDNLYLIENREYWFKLLPSIGISWTWDR